jgi:hypothetical protein
MSKLACKLAKDMIFGVEMKKPLASSLGIRSGFIRKLVFPSCDHHPESLLDFL